VSEVRTRYLATYYLPGLLFPELTKPVEIPNTAMASVVLGRPRPDWYAAKVDKVAEEGLWSEWLQATDWIERESEKVTEYIIGDVIHYSDPAYAGAEFDTLRGNLSRLDPGGFGVKTRIPNVYQVRSAWECVVSVTEIVTTLQTTDLTCPDCHHPNHTWWWVSKELGSTPCPLPDCHCTG